MNFVILLHHFGVRRVLEELVDIRVAQLPIVALVREMVATELVVEDNVYAKCQ